MKKKVLSIALVLSLLAIMVGGTLAYFTAEDEVTNTFTVGSVKIEIYENDKETVDDTMTFGPLTPVVNVEDPSADISYVNKVVDVKNTGNNRAYVRVHIAVPTKLVWCSVSMPSWNPSPAFITAFSFYCNCPSDPFPHWTV